MRPERESIVLTEYDCLTNAVNEQQCVEMSLRLKKGYKRREMRLLDELGEILGFHFDATLNLHRRG